MANVSSDLAQSSPLALEVPEPSLVEQRWQRVSRYGFQLAGYNMLAPEGLYCELLSGFKIARLPNSPEVFLGLVNVRGNLVPVYELESLLGLPTPKRDYAIVLGELSHAAAFIIPAKPQTLAKSALATQAAAKQLPAILQRCVVETQVLDNTQWHTLDHLKLFNEVLNAV